jgi:hypothetical protein
MKKRKNLEAVSTFKFKIKSTAKIFKLVQTLIDLSSKHTTLSTILISNHSCCQIKSVQHSKEIAQVRIIY